MEIGCGGEIRTHGLQVMSLTIYQTALLHDKGSDQQPRVRGAHLLIQGQACKQRIGSVIVSPGSSLAEALSQHRCAQKGVGLLNPFTYTGGENAESATTTPFYSSPP